MTWIQLDDANNLIETEVMQLPDGCLVRCLYEYTDSTENGDHTAGSVSVVWVPGVTLQDFGLHVGDDD